MRRSVERAERDAKIVLDFLDNPMPARRLARLHHVSEATVRRALKSGNVDITLYADDIDLAKARLIIVDVSKFYGRHSVEEISSMISQPPRIVRAAIYLGVQDGVITGPWKRAAS